MSTISCKIIIIFSNKITTSTWKRLINFTVIYIYRSHVLYPYKRPPLLHTSLGCVVVFPQNDVTYLDQSDSNIRYVVTVSLVERSRARWDSATVYQHVSTKQYFVVDARQTPMRNDERTPDYSYLKVHVIVIRSTWLAKSLILENSRLKNRDTRFNSKGMDVSCI